MLAHSIAKLTPPFTNLEEMANQNQYKFGTISTSFSGAANIHF